MDVEMFLQRIKEINTKMEATLGDYFLNAITTIDDNTKNTFFKQRCCHKQFIYSCDSKDVLTDLSCKLICFSVSDITTNNINKMIKTNKCNQESLTSWFNTNGNYCCKQFLADYVFRDHGKATNDLLENIYEEVMKSRFARSFLIGEAIAAQNIHAMALMSVLEVILTAEKFKKVQKRLEEDSSVGIDFQGYKEFNWATGVIAVFIKGGAAMNEIKNYVMPAVTDVQTETWTETVDFGRGHTGVRTKTHSTYAKPMKDWLNSTGKNYYEKSGNPDKSGCVLQGTPILMADGSVKLVEEIVQGDEVLSIGGFVSVVSNEKIMNTQVEWLYSINNDSPFMSLEHPILCQDGFKSLNPHLSNQIASDLHVTQLKEGDLINKAVIGEDGKFTYKVEVVEKINISKNPGIVCYDLHFSSGYDSYHANGYCCALIYPKITASYIKEKVNHLFNNEEKNELLSKLKTSHNEYIKLFGQEALDFVLKAIEQPNHIKPAVYHLFNEESESHFRFSKIKFNHSDLQLNYLTYINNTIVFDDTPTQAYHEDNFIYFHYMNKYPAAIQLLHGGLLARGVIQKDNHYHHFAAIFEDEYHLIKDGNVIAKMVITQKEQDDEYAPIAYLKDLDGNILAGFTLAVSHKQMSEGYYALCVDISSSIMVDNAIEYLNMNIPQSIHLIFDVMATKAVEDERIEKGNGITAVLIDDNLNKIHNLSLNYQQNISPRAHNIYTNPQNKIFNQSLQNQLKNNIPLSVERLYSLPMPEQLSLVHQNSFAKLYTIMYFEAEDDWLSLIGQVKPTVEGGDLSVTEKNLANQYQDFLKNKLAKAIISNSVGNMDDKDVKKEVEKISGFFDKLDYFLQGDDDPQCMQNNKDFQNIMSQLNANSYLSYVSELNEFINDDKKKWATSLYNYCNRDEVLVNIALKTPTSMEMDPFRKHLSTMMDLLDSSQKKMLKGRKNLQTEQTTYAAKFQQNLLNRQLGDMVGLLNGLPEQINKENLKDGLIEVARQLYYAVMEEKTFYGQKLDNESVENIKKEIINYDVDKYIAEVSVIITNFTDILVAGTEKWLDLLLNSKFKCVTSAMCTIGLLSVCSLIFNGGRVDWSKPTETVDFISSIIQTVAAGVDMTITIAVGSVFKQSTFTAKELLNATSRMTNSGYFYLDWGDGGGELFGHDSLLEAFKIIDTVAKIVNILGLVVSDVLLFIDVFEEGETWKIVMDSIQIIDIFILTGISVLELFSINIPVVGEVCIIISVLTAIVSLIVGSLEESPAGQFIKDVSNPFITPLPMPSDEYIKHKEEINLCLKKLNLAIE